MNIKCRVCNQNMNYLLSNQSLSVYKCKNCGLGFTQNIEKQSGNYHRDDNYIKSQKQFENIYLKRTNLVNKFSKTKGKVLEIGSSTGLMLKLFQKKGWDILGIEMSKKTAEFARKQGIATLITSFELASLPQKSFEAIVLNHTLEHMEDYKEVLKKINYLLTNNGVLFIDVPNFGGFSAKILGKKWPYLLPNEHYWHFTLKSLSKIMKKNKFNIIYSESSSGIWDYQNPWLELWQSFSTFKKRFFINFLTMIPNFIISKFNQGSGLIIIAQKMAT